MTRLVAVPNVSEGRDEAVLDAIGAAFATHAEVLHRSADADHHRAVFFLAGEPGRLHRALAAGAAEAAARIDLRRHDGLHPRVGALDVAPVVFLEEAQRGAAIAEALLAADAIGAAGIPVFLYGELAGGRTRAELRKGGPAGLAERGTPPDYGPAELHPTAGATLVAARAPLIAFNLELAPPATLADARGDRGRDPRGRGGLPGVRALGLRLERQDVVQVSTNIEDHRAVTAAAVLDAVRAPRGGRRRPSSSRPRRRPRSPAGRRTSNCACRGRSKPCWGANVSVTMAQTKRKRRTKHRGNAAGIDRGARPHRPQAQPRPSARRAARARARTAASTSRPGRAPRPAPAWPRSCCSCSSSSASPGPSSRSRRRWCSRSPRS